MLVKITESTINNDRPENNFAHTKNNEYTNGNRLTAPINSGGTDQYY
jgi:hypothetical protein